MKYRKKPVVVEAYQTDKELDIETLEGTMHASVGDYIITGVRGEQYPCKPDIFEQTYEPADTPASPWHRVEEPPKEYGTYIVCWKDGEKFWWEKADWDEDWCTNEPNWYSFRDSRATIIKPDYWMPIEPPKE